MLSHIRPSSSPLNRNAQRSASRPRLQSPAPSLRPYPPRGISLLEVLIAMFVLLFGLMGVAAIFPVGNHYAAKGDQYDRGSALAGSAFAEMKARGMLRPGNWIYPDATPVMNANGVFNLGANAGNGYVIDPLGASEILVAADVAPARFFPFNGNGGSLPGGWNLAPTTQWPLTRVTFPKLTALYAQSVFRLRDDIKGDLPQATDRPGIQRWKVADLNSTPKNLLDDTPLARDYAGSYSWLATVMPTGPASLIGMQPADVHYGSQLYEVSVAVFYKRDVIPSAASEQLLQAELLPGGDLLLYSTSADIVDAALKEIHSSHWIALCGMNPASGKFVLRWYRLLALDDETNTINLVPSGTAQGRHAMVEGPAWPVDRTPPNSQWSSNLRAILLPNVIGVATQTVKLDTE